MSMLAPSLNGYRIKNSDKTIVDIIGTNGDLVVRKTYTDAYTGEFLREIHNLKTLKRLGFDNYTHFLNFDSSTHSLEFPYVGQDLESYIRDSRIDNDTLDSFIRTMLHEIEFMQKLHRDNIRLFDPNETPYFYIHKAADRGILPRENVEKIIRDSGKKELYSRADPEATNYLVNGSNILSNDFANFRLMNPLYPLAYFLTHLNKPDKNLPVEQVSSVKNYLINKGSKELGSNGNFEPTLLANSIEIYSELAYKHLLKMEQNPIGSELYKEGRRNYGWITKEINKLLKKGNVEDI